MIKLFVGTMGCGKTKTIYDLQSKIKNSFVIVPSVCKNRLTNDKNYINSRDGSRVFVNFYIDKSLGDVLELLDKNTTIFIDECQFLQEWSVDILCNYQHRFQIYLFGLRNEYTGLLFPIMKKLFSIASQVEILDNVLCDDCKKNIAIFDHKTSVNCDAVNSFYNPKCFKCFNNTTTTF